MKKTPMAVSAAVLVAVVACSDRNYQAQPQVYQQPAVVAAPAPAVIAAPAPVIVQQHDSGVGTALAAGAVGYMLGSSRSEPRSVQAAAPVQHTTVVNKTVVVQNNTRVSAPAPAPAATPAPAPVSLAKPAAPAPRPSYGQSWSSVAKPAPAPARTTGSYASASRSTSSFSSSSRSSFSSGGRR